MYIHVSILLDSDLSSSTLLQPEDISFRLHGGASPSEGILQFRSTPNETWNTVCNPSPVIHAALCKELGYRVLCRAGNVADLFPGKTTEDFEEFPLKGASIVCSMSSVCSPVPDDTARTACLPGDSVWVTCDAGIKGCEVVHQSPNFHVVVTTGHNSFTSLINCQPFLTTLVYLHRFHEGANLAPNFLAKLNVPYIA